MKNLFRGLSLYDFQKRFSDDISCIDALTDLKWPYGFSCRYCSYTNYCHTKRYGERRCCSCKKPESATAHTLFHKIKFPLHKAFMMMYLIATTKKGISALELHRKMGVHKRTALLFKRKVMCAMASYREYKMEGYIEVDKMVVYANHPTHNKKENVKRKLVVIAVQRCGRGISRAYARHIDQARVNQIRPFFLDHISRHATVQTDSSHSYQALKEYYPGVFQLGKDKKKHFRVLNRFVRCLRAWLRGIFGKVRDLQAYLDEYVFKFNRHRMKGGIFNTLIGRMMNHPPQTYAEIFGVS